MIFTGDARAVDAHYGSYFVADLVPRETVTGELCSQDLKLDTSGGLAELSSNPDYLSVVKTTIEADVAALRETAHLAAPVSPGTINEYLDTFEYHLFTCADDVEIAGGTAKGFRKVFYSTAIVDFHDLVQLIIQTTPPTVTIKQIYTDLTEKMSMCIGGIEFTAQEGLDKLIAPSGGPACSLTVLREKLVTATIEEHVRAFVKAGELSDGNSGHVINYLKAQYAGKYGIQTPKDTSMYFGFKTEFTYGLDRKLEQALSVTNLVTVIVDECYAAFFQVLERNQVKFELLDTVCFTEPAMDGVSEVLAKFEVKCVSEIMTNLRKTCHSPYILKEFLGWLAQELKLKRTVTETEKAEERITEICDAVGKAITETGCIRKERALPLAKTAGFQRDLGAAFRETGGVYIKSAGSDAVSEVISSDSFEYLLLSQLRHNLWVVIAGGLQATVVTTEPVRINVTMFQQVVTEQNEQNEQKFFTFTHGLSYFWVEKGFDKRPVTIADICKIEFKDWKDEDLLRCFDTAIKSPFTLKDIGAFLRLNVISNPSRRPAGYTSRLTKTIQEELQMYAPIVSRMDDSDARSPWLAVVLKGLKEPLLYIRLLEKKLRREPLNAEETVFLLERIQHKACFMMLSDALPRNQQNLIRDIIENEGFAYRDEFGENILSIYFKLKVPHFKEHVKTMLNQGVFPKQAICVILLTIYAITKQFEDAEQLMFGSEGRESHLDEWQVPVSIQIYNAYLCVCAKTRQAAAAQRVLNILKANVRKRRGIIPDHITCVSLLSVYAETGEFEKAERLVFGSDGRGSYLDEWQVPVSIKIYCAYLCVCAKTRKAAAAQRVLDILKANVRKRRGIIPDHITCVSLLSVYAETGEFEKAERLVFGINGRESYLDEWDIPRVSCIYALWAVVDKDKFDKNITRLKASGICYSDMGLNAGKLNLHYESIFKTTCHAEKGKEVPFEFAKALFLYFYEKDCRSVTTIVTGSNSGDTLKSNLTTFLNNELNFDVNVREQNFGLLELKIQPR